MSGQMMNYEQYKEYIKTMAPPIMPSELPKRKINFRAIAQYAEEKSICIAALSDDEKEKIIETIGRK